MTTADQYGVTPEDHKWALQALSDPALEWIFAKTMTDFPHEYIVHPRTKGFSREDYERAARVFRTFGKPGKFHSYTRLYLHDQEAGYRYWSMDDRVEDTDLINRAPIDVVYGTQDAPDTEPTHGEHTFYDTIASEYDRLRTTPSDIKENMLLRRLINELFPSYAPSILDIGCGTGLLLDLKVASPSIYTGVDPSKGMLNHLVAKHPKIKKLIPSTAEEALLGGRVSELSFPYELVVALFGSASYLTMDALEAMVYASNGKAIFMVYEEGYAPSYYEEAGEKPPEIWNATRKKVIELQREFGGDLFKIGKFDTAVIRGQAR